MSSILARLQALFRDVLGDDGVTVSPESDAESIPGYDSLAHINIISAVEQEFGVSFEFREILRLQTVGDMIALIEQKKAVAA